MDMACFSHTNPKKRIFLGKKRLLGHPKFSIEPIETNKAGFSPGVGGWSLNGS